ncbi:Uncharacterised protein [Mycobacteroides abscessus subsp. abscessus]|nr:Uncharacterised protein [Mycobacteroides abscessus subsp. abscessus]
MIACATAAQAVRASCADSASSKTLAPWGGNAIQIRSCASVSGGMSQFMTPPNHGGVTCRRALPAERKYRVGGSC